MIKISLLLTYLVVLYFSSSSFAQQKKKITEIQVIKFDNYDAANGEQKIYKETFPDSINAPQYNIAFAMLNFHFPPANDTLTKILAGKKTPEFMPVQKDAENRIVRYYRNAKENYEFEYNSEGNLRYIKRWGAKHVTAQITFIYVH
jgi:YD repeat-containing protein